MTLPLPVHNSRPAYGPSNQQRAFTIIELVIVIVVIGLLLGLAIFRLGGPTFWAEEGLVRKLSETMVFLHHQAVSDQAYYAVEFDLTRNSYRVGVMRAEEDVNSQLAYVAADVGNLSLELAAFLNPSLGSAQSMIPPPSYPSLAEVQPLPRGVKFDDIRTMRGKTTQGTCYILFSPRGFSEFGVVHLRLSGGEPITILVNPFTGNTEIFRKSYRDFEWTYGKTNKES